MKAARRLLVVLAVVAAWPALAVQDGASNYQGPAAEQFLLKGRIAKTEDAKEGVTQSKIVTVEYNGATHRGLFKTIDESKAGVTTFANGSGEIGFQDSWQTEIAAYQVDLIIGLGLVPATIERKVGSSVGSIQWFVDYKMKEAERREQKIAPPDLETWNRAMLKVRLFDQLIANVDRHLKNILVTENFEVRLIDHSRSFRENRELKAPGDLTRFSKSLLEGIKRLEKKELKKRAGRYLSDAQIDRLLQRREAILALAKKLVAERGEAAVIYP
jgi:hypothetical protein